jgi:hypothetical protein
MIDNSDTTSPYLKPLTKVIEVVVGLFAFYVVAYVWVYGFIPDLISSIVLWLK